MGFWHFFRNYIYAGIALVLGAVISAGSLLLHGYALHEMGLPVDAWVAIGLFILFSGVIGVLYQALAGPNTGSTTLRTSNRFPAHEIEPRSASKILAPLDIWLETTEAPQIHYKRKLRIVVQNISGKNVLARAGVWERRGGTDIQIRPLERHLWQVEGPSGWDSESWGPGEREEVLVRPGGVLRTWIGLHDGATDHEVRRRLVQGTVGILTIPLVVDGQPTQQKLTFGPISTQP